MVCSVKPLENLVKADVRPGQGTTQMQGGSDWRVIPVQDPSILQFLLESFVNLVDLVVFFRNKLVAS